MSQFIQKYTLVQFFESTTEGYEYASNTWPLHSTLVDTFAIDWSVDELVAKLTKLLSGYAMVSSEAEDDKYFGEDGQTQVVLLDRTVSLVKLHLDLLVTLQQGGLILNDPQFARDGFLPHTTVRKHARFNKGDRVWFTSLSIVDMFPEGDPYKRKVIKTIKIGY